MSALRIVKDGAPVLKKTAAPVKTITKRVKRLLDDMAETMYSAEGVGWLRLKSTSPCKSWFLMTATD